MFLQYQDQTIRTRVSKESTFFSEQANKALRKITVDLPLRGLLAKSDFLIFLTHLPDKLISLKDDVGRISKWVLVNYSHQFSEKDSNIYYSLELQEQKNHDPERTDKIHSPTFPTKKTHKKKRKSRD